MTDEELEEEINLLGKEMGACRDIFLSEVRQLLLTQTIDINDLSWCWNSAKVLDLWVRARTNEDTPQTHTFMELSNAVRVVETFFGEAMKMASDMYTIYYAGDSKDA